MSLESESVHIQQIAILTVVLMTEHGDIYKEAMKPGKENRQH